nr:hypothetical protein [Fusarium oxysporum]
MNNIILIAYYKARTWWLPYSDENCLITMKVRILLRVPSL